jgi:hypothetical protein
VEEEVILPLPLLGRVLPCVCLLEKQAKQECLILLVAFRCFFFRRSSCLLWGFGRCYFLA